ncbi:hypothetical protein WAI453_013563 [Rhynchosporium graminicola]
MILLKNPIIIFFTPLASCLALRIFDLKPSITSRLLRSSTTFTNLLLTITTIYL